MSSTKKKKKERGRRHLLASSHHHHHHHHHHMILTVRGQMPGLSQPLLLTQTRAISNSTLIPQTPENNMELVPAAARLSVTPLLRK
ncbi:hypothetical protein LX36DRAFT_196000 [Colletotrichum falcatum]|nr:hypothetical protein LX36DRAFT_196000 [Colletotrichum falcatum]